MHSHLFLLALAVCAPTLSAVAAPGQDPSKVIEKPVVADTPEAFAQQTAWIEQELQPEGRYEFANPTDRQRVRTLLTQMANLLQRAGSVAAMDHDTKIQMFNDQEEVNGILKHNDANRLVCESRKPIGSNIPQTHCHTFRQIEETARNTKIGMQQFDLSRLCNGNSVETPCAPGTHQHPGGSLSH